MARIFQFFNALFAHPQSLEHNDNPSTIVKRERINKTLDEAFNTSPYKNLLRVNFTQSESRIDENPTNNKDVA